MLGNVVQGDRAKYPKILGISLDGWAHTQLSRQTKLIGAPLGFGISHIII